MSQIQIADHAPLVYTPNFFDPAKAYQHYVPNLEAAKQEGIAYARKHGLETAQRLMKRGVANAAMFVDLEDDFRDDGRLPVTGCNDVVLRMVVRAINGTVLPHFTGVLYSQDGHPTFHISYDSYWRDQNGDPLDLSTRKAACLTLEDEKNAIFRCYGFDDNGIVDLGYYRAAFDRADSVAYWKHLQATGQGDIWVFAQHCTLGTDGVNLHPFLAETMEFMAGARSFNPTPIFKGHISSTDWFGPLCPCRPDPNHAQGSFQKVVIDAFKAFSTIEYSGVAQDFCLHHMKAQTLEHLAGTSGGDEYVKRLRFVNDGTAPIVPNAQHVLDLDQKARDNGVQFINHDTPFPQ